MMARMVLNGSVIYQNLNKYEKRTEFAEFIKVFVHETLCEYSLAYAVADTQKNEPKPPKRKKPRTAAPLPRPADPQPGPADPQPGPADPQPGPSRVVHGLMKIPGTEKKKRPQKRCRICSREGKEKWVRLQCDGCQGKPGLCSPEHYKIFHQK